MSENIEVRSLVGRYLEQPRLLGFGNGGNQGMYLSSADWMTRNLDRRVEVSVPIKSPELQRELQSFLDFQLEDSVNVRRIDANMKNEFVKSPGGRKSIDAHTAMYDFYRRRVQAKK